MAQEAAPGAPAALLNGAGHVPNGAVAAPAATPPPATAPDAVQQQPTPQLPGQIGEPGPGGAPRLLIGRTGYVAIAESLKKNGPDKTIADMQRLHGLAHPLCRPLLELTDHLEVRG